MGKWLQKQFVVYYSVFTQQVMSLTSIITSGHAWTAAARHWHGYRRTRTCQHFLDVLPAAPLDDTPDWPLYQIQQVVVGPELDQHRDREGHNLQLT